MTATFLFPDHDQTEFDFDSLIKADNLMTICGIKVKIDRIYRDLTGTTVLAVSGIVVIRGIRLRGVWDALGNIIEIKKSLPLLFPKGLLVDLNNLFTPSMESSMQLVRCENV